MKWRTQLNRHTRGVLSLACAGISVLALVAVRPGAARAQVLFATGFEAPDYADGSQLTGQQGWYGVSVNNPPGFPFNLNPQAAVISSARASSGTQSVQVCGTNLQADPNIPGVTGGYYSAIGSYRQPVNFDAGPAGITFVQADIRVDGALTPGTDFFSAAVGALGTGDTGIGEMKISSDGYVHAYTGDDAAPTFLLSEPISLNAWHTLAIEDNFATDTSTFFVDGAQLGSFSFPSDYNDDNILQRGSLLTYAAPDGKYANTNYRTYYDNFSIVAVPETGAVPEPGAYGVFASLVLSAVGFLRRKRTR
jgi:hypothetical protein